MLSLLVQNKVFTVGAIVAGALVLWFFLSERSASPTGTSILVSEPVAGGAGPANQDLIETLIALRAIRLDGVIFAEPAFSLLKDFSTQITSEPVGRPNPFAPLSSGGGASGSAFRDSSSLSGQR